MSAQKMLLLALLSCSCWSVVASATDQSTVRVEMGGIKQMRYDRNGKLAAEILAERATVDDEGMLVMDEVKSTVYTEDGEEVSIRASKGTADTEGTGDAIFEGDLRVSFSDLVATTSRATWCESDKTVRGSDEIVLEGRRSKVIGSGFTVFTSEDKAVIYRPRGTIQLETVKNEARHDEEG